jgi:hypothetical protein
MAHRFGFLALVLILLFAGGPQAQTNQKPESAPTQTKQQAAKKDPPTLGFNRIKDVPPIMDMDAENEEREMQKKLPNNDFVKTKRILHETSLMNDFVEGFKSSKECNGITFYLKTEKRSDFTIQISVAGHDDPSGGEQSWIWILGWPGDPSPADKTAHGMGGMGHQTNAKLTARDACLTIWDDVDPNHFKKPGGKIE